MDTFCFTNLDGRNVTTLDALEAGLRYIYDLVCNELDKIDPEDYEFYIRLEACATSLAALISFVKERITGEVLEYE